jgi:uncharacterized protein YkwD
MAARALLIAGTAAAALASSQSLSAEAPARTCRAAGIESRTPAERLIAERATRCLLRAVRRRHGLVRLRGSRRVQDAAYHHARHMVRQHYFAHVGPRGVTVVDRLRRSGYLDSDTRWIVGEVLALGRGGLPTPRSAVRAWLRSPSHRSVILTAEFRDIGVGVAAGRYGTTFTVDLGHLRGPAP